MFVFSMRSQPEMSGLISCSFWTASTRRVFASLCVSPSSVGFPATPPASTNTVWISSAFWSAMNGLMTISQISTPAETRKTAANTTIRIVSQTLLFRRAAGAGSSSTTCTRWRGSGIWLLLYCFIRFPFLSARCFAGQSSSTGRPAR